MRRTDERPIQLPPTVDHPLVQKAGAEYERLKAETTAEWRRLSDLEESRHSAVDADREEFGRALRAGEDDPGQKAVEAIDKAILASRRRVEALQLAVVASRDDLVDTVESVRDEWTHTIDERITQTQVAFAAAVEALDVAHGEFADALALRNWLNGFPERPIWARPALTSDVRALIGRNSDPFTWAAVLGALREHANPPDRTFPAALARLKAESEAPPPPEVEAAILVNAAAPPP